MLIECANCGAPLHVAGNQSLVTCNYCQRQNRVQQTQTMAAQTPPHWRPPSNWTPPQHVPAQSVQLHYQAHAGTRKKASGVVGMSVGLVALTMLGGVVFAVLGVSSKSDVGGAMAIVNQQIARVQNTTGPGSGGVTPAGEHLQWHASGQPPAPADANADGIEDVVGFYRLLDGGDSVMHLGAFSGKDFTRIWKTRPLGTLQDRPVMVLSGEFVGVTDSNNQLHVLELASGKTLTAVQLSDKAQTLCSHPDQPGQVWVEQADEKHQLVDLKGGTKQAAPRPPWCLEEVGLIENSECWRHDFRRHRHARSRCLSPKGHAPSDGFQAGYVMANGDHRVAIGSKHPGTAVPTAAGYSADGQRVLWNRKLAAPGQTAADGVPELADLLGSRVVFQYELKHGGARLAALDAKDGKSLWDVPIPRSGDGSHASTFRVSAQRVYLPHWTWLDIFDVTTGKHLGTIGKW